MDIMIIFIHKLSHTFVILEIELPEDNRENNINIKGKPGKVEC